jgi:hypothetical protein
MRFFCTCDCHETAKGLEKATEKIERLERQYRELDALYARLQGRYARTFRGEDQPAGGNGGEGPRSDEVKTPAGNPAAIALLRKRGRL